MRTLEPLLLLSLNWLIPGVGFMIKGLWRKGLALFIVINATFCFGLLLHGAVTLPIMDYRHEAFNWVNILTVIGQLGNGGMSAFSILHERLSWSWFEYKDFHPWADLASLYFLVSGTMNYFSTCNLYDRLFRAEQTGAAVSKA